MEPMNTDEPLTAEGRDVNRRGRQWHERMERYHDNTMEFKKGSDYDLSGGPVQNRGCTDCLFCVLLLFAWFVFAGIFFVSAEHADLRNLHLWTNGQDYDQHICGVDESVKDFPVMVYTLKDSKNVATICTKNCPTTAGDMIDCPDYTLADGLCKSPVGTTRVGFFCVPNNYTRFGDHAASVEKAANDAAFINFRNFVFAIQNIMTALPVVLASLVAAVIAGLLFLAILQKCAGCLIWLTIFISIASFIGIGVAAILHGDKYGTEVGLDAQEMTAMGGVLVGLGVLEAIIACCCITSIKIAVGILRTAAEFLEHSPGTLMQPIAFAIWHASLYMIGACAIALVYATEPMTGADRSSIFKGNTTPVILFLVFFTLWQNGFASGVSQFTVGHSVCTWYFAQIDGDGNKVLPGGSLPLRGASVALWHHSGSISFGSLLVGICGLLRMLLVWVKEHEEGDRNPVHQCFVKISECFIMCMDRFLTLLNKNAYIQIAMLGKPFCQSAKVSLGIAMRYPATMAIITNVSEVLRILGCVTCMAAGTLLSWWLLTGPAQMAQSPVGPCIAVAIISLLIGECIMHPFSQAAVSVLHCYIADKEMTHHEHGPGQEPFYTPAPLKSFIGDHCHDARVRPTLGAQPNLV